MHTSSYPPPTPGTPNMPPRPLHAPSTECNACWDTSHLVQGAIAVLSSRCNSHVMSPRQQFTALLSILQLLHFFLPPSWEKGVEMDAPFRAEHGGPGGFLTVKFLSVLILAVASSDTILAGREKMSSQLSVG